MNMKMERDTSISASIQMKNLKSEEIQKGMETKITCKIVHFVLLCFELFFSFCSHILLSFLFIFFLSFPFFFTSFSFSFLFFSNTFTSLCFCNFFSIHASSFCVFVTTFVFKNKTLHPSLKMNALNLLK